MAPPRIALPCGRRALWIPVLAVMVIAHRGLAAEGATDANELRRRFAGEYLFVGGAPERALVPAAVERSVDGMFFIARGIAYDRLLRNCEICSRYSLALRGGSISVGGSCQLPDVSPDDGREVVHRTKLGETSKLSQRLVGETLVQEFRGDGGARRVVWTLLPDGDTLRMQVLITSKHLPRPVDYTLTYRRKSATPAEAPDSGTPPDG
jgi:hypothetical protein